MDVVDLDAVRAPGRTRSGAALRVALDSLGDRLSADWLPWAPTLVACSVEPYGSWTVTVASRLVAFGVHEEDLEDDFVEWTA